MHVCVSSQFHLMETYCFSMTEYDWGTLCMTNTDCSCSLTRLFQALAFLSQACKIGNCRLGCVYFQGLA